MTHNQEIERHNVLARLRAQVPDRALTPEEVRHVVERQATRLLRDLEIGGPPVSMEEIATRLSHVRIDRVPDLPASGTAAWDGQAWVLVADANEPKERQRASLAHELGHVIYHPLAAVVLPDGDDATSEERLERACDYFAACLLMPRMWVKRAYFEDHIQDATSMARLFAVSVQAMCVRFQELGFAVTRDCRELEAA